MYKILYYFGYTSIKFQRNSMINYFDLNMNSSELLSHIVDWLFKSNLKSMVTHTVTT